MIQEKTGVLLVNTGSPAAPTPQAVGAYLSEFLMDGAVRPLPALLWWLILHACILPRRKKTSAAKYREVWLEKGSPLVVYAQSLSRGVQRMFDDDRAVFPEGCRVVCGMSYGDPSIRDALECLRQEGCQRLAVIPLYPQSAHSTTGSALERYARVLKRWAGLQTRARLNPTGLTRHMWTRLPPRSPLPGSTWQKTALHSLSIPSR